jgi:hypothetical protein
MYARRTCWHTQGGVSPGLLRCCSWGRRSGWPSHHTASTHGRAGCRLPTAPCSTAAAASGLGWHRDGGCTRGRRSSGCCPSAWITDGQGRVLPRCAAVSVGAHVLPRWVDSSAYYSLRTTWSARDGVGGSSDVDSVVGTGVGGVRWQPLTPRPGPKDARGEGGSGGGSARDRSLDRTLPPRRPSKSRSLSPALCAQSSRHAPPGRLWAETTDHGSHHCACVLHGCVGEMARRGSAHGSH